MDVTAKLLAVFQVDKQLRGLRSRLTGAEKFLGDQSKELSAILGKQQTLEAQLKALAAQAAGFEGEAKRIEARVTVLREQMNTAKTNREYQAFLVEMNTFKVDKDKNEGLALEAMTKHDELKKQLAELGTARDQREQVKKVAEGERDARFKEIETQLNELKAERDQLAGEVPADVLTRYQRLVDMRGEDAMGPVEVQDRKRHEYTCGVCQMSLPVDTVSLLMSTGKLTFCSACQCLLYLDNAAKEALMPPASTKR
jgi:predicted  nucleic acid-binding Zn-ribbon protein